MKYLITAPSPQNCLLFTDTNQVFKYDFQANKIEVILQQIQNEVTQSPEIIVNLDMMENEGQQLYLSTNSKNLYSCNKFLLQLFRKTSIIEYYDNELLVIERDGTLYQFNQQKQQLNSPDFGRSISLTAFNNKFIGDRDGIVFQIGDKFSKIRMVFPVTGYIIQIQNEFVLSENGIYSLNQQKFILKQKNITTIKQISNQLFYVIEDKPEHKADLFVIDINKPLDQPLCLTQLQINIDINFGKVRQDVSVFQLVEYKKKLFILNKIEATLLNDLYEEIQTFKQWQYAELQESIINDLNVVKVHHQGAMRWKE